MMRSLFRMLLPAALVLAFAQNGTAQSLVHYWNFNDATSNTTLLTPTHTTGGASIAVNKTINLSATNEGFEVSNLNARNGDPSGSHFRFQDPASTGVVDLVLPTTGFEDIIVKMAARRSNAGAQQWNVSYSTNGTTYTSFTTITLNNAGVDLVTVDLSAITAADNNANFKIKLETVQGTGGTGGNHRIDNLTMEGTSLGGDIFAPLASFTPTSGSINVAIGVNPEVTFSEPIQLIGGDPATAASLDTVVQLKLNNQNGAVVPCSLSVAGNVVTLIPLAALQNNQTYWVGVKNGRIEDLAGNDLAAGTSATFTTIAVQTIFAPGDLLLIAYQMNATPNTDRFAVLTNVNILPGTIVNFTDYKYTTNAQAQCDGGNRIVWTAPAGGVPKGTVIYFENDVPTVSVGTISTGGFGLGAGGDQIIIYTGTPASPTYITALSSNLWASAPFTTCTGGNSLLPAGLADGMSSINLSTTIGNVGGNTANAYYAGPMSGMFVKDSILNPSKWIGSASGTAAQTWPTYVFAGPPQVVSAAVQSNTTIQVVFSTAMNLASAQNMANYTGIAGLQSAVLSGGNTVTLTYNAAFIAGNSYSLQVANVLDANSTSMFAPYNFNFTFNTTATFAARYTVVNEGAGTANITLNITNPAPFSFDINLRPEPQSTVSAADINFASQTINVPGNATTYTITIPVVDDAVVEDDEYLFFEILNVNGASFSGLNFHTLYIKDNDRQAPVATKEISLSHVGSFDPSTTGSTTEVVAYDASTKRLFATSAIQDRFDIIDFSNPTAPVTISSVDMSPYGGITSIAVKPGLLAVTSPNANEQLPGSVVFFTTNGVFISQVTVGALPDMITFTPDGTKVLTANEGQPNNSYSNDPEGSISIIDVSGASIMQSNVTTLDFTGFNASEAALIASGVRKASTIGTLSQNLEPEYITISADGTTAWVTLQENNTIAKVDLGTNTITALLPMGTKNNALAGNGFDASDTQTEILLANWPVKSFYIPDAIANYTVGGVTYLVTANEGDEREYGPVNERTTVGAGGTVLNPANFPHAAMLKEATNLGRFRITNLDGRNTLGQYDELYCVGSRSFSIWNATTGALEYDSGNDIEQITAADPVFGALFNADNESNQFKSRSRAKGPEPEGVVIGTMLGQTYSFVALERIGGVMVYNITNPNAPVFVDYINTRSTSSFAGDIGAETLIFIPSDKSPDGKTYLVVANEISGTLSIFKIDLAACTNGQVTLSSPGMNAFWKSKGASSTTTFYYGLTNAIRINANVTGGVGPFTYQWSNAGPNSVFRTRSYYPASSIDLFEPTSDTTIYVTVIDQGAGCQYDASLFIDWSDEYYCYKLGNTWYIKVCQNGQSVCVPWSQAKTLLANNLATLGECLTPKTDASALNSAFVQVQPNPASSTVHVVAGNVYGQSTLRIVDVNGRLLLQSEMNAAEGIAEDVLDVSRLPIGIYFVQLQNEGVITTEKLMIAR